MNICRFFCCCRKNTTANLDESLMQRDTMDEYTRGKQSPESSIDGSNINQIISDEISKNSNSYLGKIDQIPHADFTSPDRFPTIVQVQAEDNTSNRASVLSVRFFNWVHATQAERGVSGKYAAIQDNTNTAHVTHIETHQGPLDMTVSPVLPQISEGLQVQK